MARGKHKKCKRCEYRTTGGRAPFTIMCQGRWFRYEMVRQKCRNCDLPRTLFLMWLLGDVDNKTFISEQVYNDAYNIYVFNFSD